VLESEAHQASPQEDVSPERDKRPAKIRKPRRKDGDAAQ